MAELPAVLAFAAAPDARWPARLAEVVPVVRHCEDLADLFAAASAGLGVVCFAADDAPGLDRTTVARLAALGVGVVGVLTPGASGSRMRMRELGVDRCVIADSARDVFARAASDAAAHPVRPGTRAPRPTAAAPTGRVRWREVSPRQWGGRPGPRAWPATVAVWGPAGAPGRSTTAIAIADLFAAAGADTLLVDADPYGGAVATRLGLLDEAPGLLAAVRTADRGALTESHLRHAATGAGDRLCVLTGLPTAARWPELRGPAFAAVVARAREAFDVTVIDCGFALEDDEELSYDAYAPRRNAVTLEALGAADTVVAVAAADALGLARLVAAWPDLRPHTGLVPHLLLNRARPGRPAARGLPPRGLPGRRPPFEVPFDPTVLVAAEDAGLPVTRSAPRSAVALAFGAVVDRLAPVAPPAV